MSTLNINLNITNMRSMFNSCTNLTNITALANWNVSNVTTMYCMFESFHFRKFSSKRIFLSFNFLFIPINNMYCMFNSCTNLTNITALANWNVSNVDSMRSMFSGCTFFPGASFSLVLSLVTTMQYMFYNCTNLTDITALANWNTSNVTIMQGMFYN